METIAKRLTLKFGFIQSSYWISQCAINSFAAVYLQAKHFENTQIGFILSFAAILSLLLQPMVASFADKSKKITLRYMMLILMFMVLGLALLLYFLPDSFLLITVIYILINAVEYTINPLFNSLAMEYMNQDVPMNYGLARGTGSIAFAVMSFYLGLLVDKFGADVILPVFLICYVFVILSTFLFKEDLPSFLKEQKDLLGLAVQEEGNEKKEASGLLSFFLDHKLYMVMLCGVAMIFYSHVLINTYLINIMENVGGGSSDMGISLSIAAALELPTMALFIYIVRKINGSLLIKISAFFFFIKTLLTLLAPNVAMVHFSMSLQLIAFALFTPASIYYVNDLIEKENRVKGQSMLGVANIGIAGTLANLTGGRLLDTYGVFPMLLIGTVVTAVGFLLICISVKPLPAAEAKKDGKHASGLSGEDSEPVAFTALETFDVPESAVLPGSPALADSSASIDDSALIDSSAFIESSALTDISIASDSSISSDGSAPADNIAIAESAAAGSLL